MNKKLLLSMAICAMALTANAQKIDFDFPGRNGQVTEPGYQPWEVPTQVSDTKTITVNDSESFEMTINCGDEATTTHTLRSEWLDKAQANKLVGDGFAVRGKDDDGNTPELTSESATLNFVIKGIKPGPHSMLIYTNVCCKVGTPSAPIDVLLNGQTIQSGVIMSDKKTVTSESQQIYINFTAEEGKDVTVSLVSKPDGATTYATTGIYVNAIVFDQPNPKTTALDPIPANLELHLDADNGSTELSWTPASSAVKHILYVGTEEGNWNIIAGEELTEPRRTLNNLTTHNTYYWRVDEVDAAGMTYQGETWSFRPRRLAFPGAEGYGRYAIGGRGGSVYHVTSLEDYAEGTESPIPGTFRYGIREVKGPRTIVFDVEGTIQLKARLTCSDPYVTIAGQTAPGKGILLRSAPFGMADDGITRFLRMRRGWHNDDVADMDRGLDGLGMAGNNNSIMDHCSVGWTIDEAFSSRNAKNITLQRTLISEALNDANHPNYNKGTQHGYAATIGGSIGTYHHNLLAHNEGRNWSLSGGLSPDGSYAGAHDLFNNVCYNWGGRATDGGTMEGQFVNNYYKMGPSTTQKKLLRAQVEGTGNGKQQYWVRGNIRENLNGSKTTDKEGDTYEVQWSAGQERYDDVFVSQPFFESYAKIETAEMAFKTVLSDVGANQPYFDEHDTRMVSETLAGTTSTKGSQTGKAGLIDRETDSEGFGYFPTEGEKRAADYDTDQDGMPDYWEAAMGTNPFVADNNEYQEPFGYTNLEQYLNWKAEPNYMMKPGEELAIDLTKLFAGYNKNPYFYIENDTPEGWEINMTDNIMAVNVDEKAAPLATITISAYDDEANEESEKMTRNINIYASTDATGITNVTTDNGAYTVSEVYSVNGMLLQKGGNTEQLPKGVYIIKMKNGDKVKSVKVVKN